MFNAVNLLAAEGNNNAWIMWVLLAVLVVFLFVMPMFTNRKKQKEVNDMFNSIEVGDEVMTIGGIMGKVVALTTHESGEKLMVIETGEGAEKTSMTFTVQALRLNYTKNKQRQAQLAKEKAERDAAKNHKGKEELPLAPVEAEEAQTPAEEAQTEVSTEEVKEETTSETENK